MPRVTVKTLTAPLTLPASPRLVRGRLLPARSHQDCGTRIAFPAGMPRYYFKLVDGHRVANYGAYDLEDDTAAQIAAIELARSVREARPELVGHGYAISVTDELGGDVCTILLEII
jgi:hypothetical protein